jgi:hypothetical protein
MRAFLVLAVLLHVAHGFLTPAEIEAIRLSKELANEKPSFSSLKHSFKSGASHPAHHQPTAAQSRLAQHYTAAEKRSSIQYDGENDLTFFPSDVPMEMRGNGRGRVSMLSSANYRGDRGDRSWSRRERSRGRTALDSRDAMRLAKELSSAREIERISPSEGEVARCVNAHDLTCTAPCSAHADSTCVCACA